jgi:hypothetical protein
MIGQSVPGLLTLNEGAYHIARAGELLKSTVHKLLTTGVTVGLPNSAEISARQMPRSARTLIKVRTTTLNQNDEAVQVQIANLVVPPRQSGERE